MSQQSHAKSCSTLPIAQQVLSQHQHEKYFEELLDGSVRLSDICGITREATLQIREHVQALQSALRRRKGDSSIESSINNYTCFREKMKKDAKKLITALKQMENKFGASPALDLDHPVCASKPKPTGWSLVSKLIHKGAIACEEKQEKVNQMQVVDAASDAEKTQSAHRRLEDLMISIEDLENGLECVFRRLIKTRASLLDIISQ
ncbi:hypothetical protein CIPAW_07G004800 [Carya illinoinensis]|uniref:Uncharacterized protein n=1 Tax=Carya illinoinensis TaxID=32201 RepID=A0A8T1PVW9_CARIL|nr:hypothetical protein CIPAW_07G004800 [Carya illinoinensis]